jgi:hypothetical protein
VADNRFRLKRPMAKRARLREHSSAEYRRRVPTQTAPGPPGPPRRAPDVRWPAWTPTVSSGPGGDDAADGARTSPDRPGARRAGSGPDRHRGQQRDRHQDAHLPRAQGADRRDRPRRLDVRLAGARDCRAGRSHPAQAARRRARRPRSRARRHPRAKPGSRAAQRLRQLVGLGRRRDRSRRMVPDDRATRPPSTPSSASHGRTWTTRRGSPT